VIGVSKPIGAVAVAAYWRPAYWSEVQEPPETEPRAVACGWAPGTHGPDDKGFALQERDVDVLSRLWAAGVLSTEHLHRLLFQAVTDPSIVSRRLRHLWQVGLVLRYRPHLGERGMGSAPYLWRLSRLGFGVLRAMSPLWWTARWPKAKWDARQEEREPSLDMLHSLLVADIATWAVKYHSREWVHESEPACRVSAGRIQDVSRVKELRFLPDAILTAQTDGAPDWYIEVERAAYLPTWRQKVEVWDRWAKTHTARGRVPAQIVVAGFLRDTPQRRERGIVPLLRVVPEALKPHMRVLDLEAWDQTSADPQMRSIADLLR
jgi:hypothetical protein